MIESAYIHIPFCLRKCRYCSFVSGIDINYKDEYIRVLTDEIKSKYKNEKLKTLYLGGGTPSLLDVDSINKIISCFNLYDDAEITIEVNPETVEKDKFKDLKSMGINRISLGVQSFNNDILKKIGRNHTKETIYTAYETLSEIPFNNINIDIIYGLPNQTFEIFKKDVECSISLGCVHISAYGLKIEENSYFYNNPPSNLPDDESQAQFYKYLCGKLKENNYIHYEISNFAKKGYEARHNLTYWQNKNYYGFGLNASGYEGSVRYKNLKDFELYLKTPEKKEEEIKLTKNQIKEEEIFLALRLNKGININEINKKFNIDFLNDYKEIIKKYENINLAEVKNGYCRLTLDGVLLSSEIMSEFID